MSNTMDNSTKPMRTPEENSEKMERPVKAGNTIEVIPAMDIINGCAVRLSKGDYAQVKKYSDDPVSIARLFEDNGARWLHLVDLDGAKLSRPANLKVLEDIVSATSLNVEWGGGIKSAEAVEEVLNAGAKRVICGSIAVAKPELFREWLSKYGADRIVLGADARNGRIAVNGWLSDTDIPIDELVGKFTDAGLSQVVCTDINKDGMLAGPSWELYKGLKLSFPQILFTVSGGVSSIADVETAAALGLDRIIVGKAIYENRISMEELKTWWQNE